MCVCATIYIYVCVLCAWCVSVYEVCGVWYGLIVYDIIIWCIFLCMIYGVYVMVCGMMYMLWYGVWYDAYVVVWYDV